MKGAGILRKSLSYLVITVLVLLWPIAVFGESQTTTGISVSIDDQPMELDSNEVINEEGRLLVPVRWISEALGASVLWDGMARTVTVSKEEREVLIPIDDYFVWVNGQEMLLDVPAKIIDEKTMIPLRTVSEALQFQVDWNAEKQILTILTGQELAMTVLKPVSLDQEDLKWLAKIIYAEANGEPFEGLVAVGSVVMNRVNSGLFPSTIQEVIFQKDGDKYQFTPVRTGKIDTIIPNDIAYKAAKLAMVGKDNTLGALYFYNPSISTSSWFKSKTVTIVIGHHAFVK
jgi:N-acetylmuramoyl-L-alanine amidase